MPGGDEVLLRKTRAQPRRGNGVAFVIPGRAAGANPESIVTVGAAFFRD
jgi:hypothetical protein